VFFELRGFLVRSMAVVSAGDRLPARWAFAAPSAKKLGRRGLVFLFVAGHRRQGCHGYHRRPKSWVWRQMHSATDEQLLALARTDPSAFGIFYRRHVRQVMAFLVRRAGSAEAGTELTAEVFAAALQGVPRYQADQAEPLTWLFGIARHKLTDYHRTGHVQDRARRRMGFERIAVDDQELERVERLASLEVSATVLQEALEHLPAQQREAVISRVVHEMSYAEIGDHDGTSLTVARQRVSRGLRALRHRLGDRTA
jgi:RNA polymerase sigma factor (sigma-70 family)